MQTGILTLGKSSWSLSVCIMEIWNYGLAHWSVGLLMSLEIFLVASTHRLLKAGVAQREVNHMLVNESCGSKCVCCVCASALRIDTLLSFLPICMWSKIVSTPFTCEPTSVFIQKCRIKCPLGVLWLDGAFMQWTWILPELTEWPLKRHILCIFCLLVMQNWSGFVFVRVSALPSALWLFCFPLLYKQDVLHLLCLLSCLFILSHIHIKTKRLNTLDWFAKRK